MLFRSIQLVKASSMGTGRIHRSMGLKKIGTKGRMCLPKAAVGFLDIADGDYLKFVGRKRNDIRLSKLNGNL